MEIQHPVVTPSSENLWLLNVTTTCHIWKIMTILESLSQIGWSDNVRNLIEALLPVKSLISNYGLFYNQGTSSKITKQPCFNCRTLLWFQSAFAKKLIRVRSTYSNKEKVRINQLFKKICSLVMISPKIAVPFGFSQILCSSITWNKHEELLFVNSEEVIWTRPFKI